MECCTLIKKKKRRRVLAVFERWSLVQHCLSYRCLCRFFFFLSLVLVVAGSIADSLDALQSCFASVSFVLIIHLLLLSQPNHIFFFCPSSCASLFTHSFCLFWLFVFGLFSFFTAFPKLIKVVLQLTVTVAEKANRKEKKLDGESRPSGFNPKSYVLSKCWKCQLFLYCCLYVLF